jgi:phospholipid-binding lipoprotein MlaA
MKKMLFIPGVFIVALSLSTISFAGDAGKETENRQVAQNNPVGQDYSQLFETPGVEPVKIADPIEPFNRGVFWVNDKLYFYLFKPVARVYRVVPEPVRQSVSNFFSNLATPIRFVNALLQGKLGEAHNELARFVVNTTVGVGGLFDPAKSYGKMEIDNEDLGLTFGHYGAGQGFYLVIPVLGPSSLRDGVGRVGDTFLDPWTYMVGLPEYAAAKGTEMETRLSLDKDTYEQVKKESLDPYITVRNAYAQHRQEAVEK